MNEVLTVANLRKTFKLSKKQQKLQNTTDSLKVAVNDLSFGVYEGEIFGLLGPNGAGKTTTLRAIATLISPDSGDILVKGYSAKKDPSMVRKSIGFLTSELKLEDFFTPNYLFDFFSNLHGVEEEVREERKEKLFKRFGIYDFAEVKVSELSSGMKQKASIAVSLVHDPDIIIFDEPTNGLDVITAKVVTDYLVELRNMGKTIILSTHIFSLVEKVCDRVGIIIEGQMHACDTLENLTVTKNIEEVFFDLYLKAVGDVA